jgi:hypothetical protein
MLPRNVPRHVTCAYLAHGKIPQCRKSKAPQQRFCKEGTWINRRLSKFLIPPEAYIIPTVLPNRKARSYNYLATLWFTMRQKAGLQLSHFIKFCSSVLNGGATHFCTRYILLREYDGTMWGVLIWLMIPD